jgi:hypothetical protein
MADLIRFGTFELDIRSGQLRNKGRIVRVAPQPFKLLTLLTAAPGSSSAVKRFEPQLWAGDTFIDFEQSVNFTVKQVREALNRHCRSAPSTSKPSEARLSLHRSSRRRQAASHPCPRWDGRNHGQAALDQRSPELRMQEEQRKARQANITMPRPLLPPWRLLAR